MSDLVLGLAVSGATTVALGLLRVFSDREIGGPQVLALVALFVAQLVAVPLMRRRARRVSNDGTDKGLGSSGQTAATPALSRLLNFSQTISRRTESLLAIGSLAVGLGAFVVLVAR